VLQALERITRGEDDVMWIKSPTLREQVARLLDQSSDEIDNAQRIGHILKRFQLIDPSRRKHHVGGKLYVIERRDSLNMMQRYGTYHQLKTEAQNNPSKGSNRSTSQQS
jgi:hypothetical protein